MAPEQAQNPASVDKRADIYAIGILLFEALCGQRPFAGHTIGELIGAHLFQTAEKPSILYQRKQLPPRNIDWRKLDAIIEKTLAKSTSARFQDCARLTQELEAAWGQHGQWAAASQGYSSQTSSVSALSAPRSPAQRWLIGAAVLALGLGALGGGRRWSARHQQWAVIASTAAVVPTERAAARLQAAQSGGVAERRALVAAVELVRSRALLPYVEAALRDPAAAVWPAALTVAAAVGTPEDAALRALLTQRAAQPAGTIAVELAAARLRLGAEDAIPTLTAAASGEAASPRLRATLALAMAGVVSAAALQRMLARSGPGSVAPTLRQAALLQLVKMGDAATEKQLQQALQERLVGTAARGRRCEAERRKRWWCMRVRVVLAARTQLVQACRASSRYPAASSWQWRWRRPAMRTRVELLLPLFPRRYAASPAACGRARSGVWDATGCGRFRVGADECCSNDPEPGVALTAAAALVSR